MNIKVMKEDTIAAIEATHQSIVSHELTGKSPELRFKIALLNLIAQMEKLRLTHAKDQLRAYKGVV